MAVRHCSQTNTTGTEMPFIHNAGSIEHLYIENVDPGDDVLICEG